MQKEELRNNSKELIDKIFNEINALEAKKDAVTETVKEEYEENIEVLKTIKKNLNEKYNDVQEDTENNWYNLKEAFSEASEILRKSVFKVRA